MRCVTTLNMSNGESNGSFSKEVAVHENGNTQIIFTEGTSKNGYIHGATTTTRADEVVTAHLENGRHIDDYNGEYIVDSHFHTFENYYNHFYKAFWGW